MFSFLALALAVASCTSALVIPRATPPEGWSTDYLEPYDTFHTRYLALSCESKHDTGFFDQCCHPLLATEDLSSRPAECNPASVRTLDAETTDDDDDNLPFCDDDVPPTSPTTGNPSPNSPQPPTTSSYEAVPTTTSTSSTQDLPTPTPAASVPPPNAAASNTNTGGFATYYYQNGVAGACGAVHGDNDFIAAMNGERYGNLGQQSGLCGSRVQITNTNNGKTVTVTIADACPTCNNGNSIDLSVAAFQSIATLTEGMVPIAWSFV